jgi:glycosyltransferase involved in cell wall biosynthesis
MYCGSCARDNAIARELMRLGHDVTLVPVYTPTRTDEPNVSAERVLFGGISVYLQQYVPPFRWTPRFLDRIWDSPALISRLAGRAVSNDPKLLGELTVSMLSGRSGVLRKEFEKFLDWLRHEPPPDVVNLPNSLLISMADPLREAFRAPLTCTLQGEELFIDGLVPPYRERALDLIRANVGKVDRFIAVSDYCAEYMSRFLEIPPERIAVVPLGINLEGYGRQERADAPFRIGYFARIAPEKGFAQLVDAYVRMRKMFPEGRAMLEAAGYTSPDNSAYLDAAQTVLRQAGLESEFVYHGVVDREGKIRFLQSLDVLSVPATYDEPKGLFLLEAMANGVPVVQPGHGAFPEIIARTGGGVVTPSGDVDALAAALHDLLVDRAKAQALGAAGAAGVRAHYTVDRMAEAAEAAYGEVRSGKTDVRS